MKLTLHTSPSVPLEAEQLSPAAVAGLNTARVAALPVWHGNQQARVGDFFTVTGAWDGVLHIAGDLTRVKRIGSAMSAGRLVVEGDVGAHLGAAMSGGEILVEGDAGDWVGPEMSGGRIVIKGNAGHLIGSAVRGSAVGIEGGEIIIHGNARNEVGSSMRRGLIAVGGDCGDFTGVDMLAGTIVVLGRLGARSGAGMKRGSIVSMQEAELLPTFRYACTYQPDFLRLYLLHLVRLGLPVEQDQVAGKYRRFSGDDVELNRGEVLLFSASTTGRNQ